MIKWLILPILILMLMQLLIVGCGEEEIVEIVSIAIPIPTPPIGNGNGRPGRWQSVLQQPDFTAAFTYVYAIDSQKVWAVGSEGTVVYTNDGGQKWTRRDIGATGGLSQVQFVDAQHGWILEGFETGVSLLLFHTSDEGNRWEKFTVPSLIRFYFVNAKQGYAIGAGDSILRTMDGGKNWEAKFGADCDLVAIQFINEEEGWVIGENCILHTKDGGETWEKYRGNRSFYSNVFNNNLCFINSQEGWITGLDGKLAHTMDGGKTLNLLQSPVSGFNAKIHFVDSIEGWGLDDHGAIWHTIDGGITWNMDLIDSSSDLYFIHFAQNSKSGWAVGEDGTILHYNGDGTWTLQTIRMVHLGSVYFISDRKGWVVGEKHTILHTSDGGRSWVPQKSSFLLGKPIYSNDFYDVYFVDDNTGWIVGDKEIHRTTDGGNTWIGELTKHKLNSVYFVNSQNGWTAGENGYVLHTEDGGNSWAPQRTNVGATLDDVYFVDSLKGWAVGEDGVILHTENGGERWTLQVSGTDSTLRSVHFVSLDGGCVVGADSILYTRDGGQKWTSVDNQGAWSISFANSQEGWAVAGEIEPHIVHTANGGQNWEHTGIPYTAPFRPISYSKLWGVHARGNYVWVVGPGCILKGTLY